jgi:hypothetical protein
MNEEYVAPQVSTTTQGALRHTKPCSKMWREDLVKNNLSGRKMMRTTTLAFVLAMLLLSPGAAAAQIHWLERSYSTPEETISYRIRTPGAMMMMRPSAVQEENAIALVNQHYRTLQTALETTRKETPRSHTGEAGRPPGKMTLDQLVLLSEFAIGDHHLFVFHLFPDGSSRRVYMPVFALPTEDGTFVPDERESVEKAQLALLYAALRQGKLQEGP